MNSSSSMQNLQQTVKMKTGLMKIYIGTNHVIKGPDGKNRQFKVRDVTKFPKAEKVCVCLKCGKAWPNLEELQVAHPENRVMAKQGEAHIIGWWSDDNIIEEAVVADTSDKKKDEKKELVKKVIDYNKIIGLMSDEEIPST